MFSYAAKVDIGPSEAHNDDRVLLDGRLISDGIVSGTSDGPYLLCAVCDGVGGMDNGAVAAELTLETLRGLPCRAVDKKSMEAAIGQANSRVWQRRADSGSGMLTTLSGVCAADSSLLVFNVGDSRVYRLRYKYLMRLTRDDSTVQDMVDAGTIRPAEARLHPQRNLITKCIGYGETIVPTVTEMQDDFLAGDLLLLCSDGICDALDDETLRTILFTHRTDKDLSSCCEAVCRAAVENGSLDNMSTIIIRKDD